MPKLRVSPGAIPMAAVAGTSPGGARFRPARLVPALLLALAAGGCTSTYSGRWVVWNRSAITDHERFPAESVSRDAGEPFRFAEAEAQPAFDVAVERRGRTERIDLTELARTTHTTALLVIRRDTLLFEGYFNGYDRESINTSFSTAKSVTSLLVGIAVDGGYIGDVGDPVTIYVPELAVRDARFERLTIEHLLDMRSGLRWRDHDFITGDKARAYYHPHLRRLVLEELPFTGEPGATWQYNSFNPILLGLVLERATGRSPAALLEEWLWRPLGMEFDASWSVDGTREPMVKMESGINARAVDFAKIGRLVLESGRWGEREVVSGSWLEASTRFGDECRIDQVRYPGMCYRRAWWIPEPEDGLGPIVAATGHLGQYLYVFPELDVVVVRFGRKPGGVSWPQVIRDVARQAGQVRHEDSTPVPSGSDGG
jgi:CubicO group peptidase (beta-lactamase class C family)